MSETLKDKNKLLSAFILTILVSAGLYVRLKGLSIWPAAVDEYYILKSAHNILEFGLPEYSTGGIYERGIFYQYITAFLIWSGLKAEFAARIIPAITNLLTLIPLYLLAKKLTTNTLTILLIIFAFCFSVWEVEFARFARMYSPFQLIFMFYLYSFYRFTLENSKKHLTWLFILSTISIFIYEASIFLTILNFVAVSWDFKLKTLNPVRMFDKEKVALIITSVIIFFCAYFFLNYNFREMGQSNLYPEIYLPENGHSEGTFRPAHILLSYLLSDNQWLFTLLLPVSLIVIFTLLVYKDRNLSLLNKAIIIISFVLTFLNLFGLTVILLTMFMLLSWIKASDYFKTIKYLLPVMVFNAVFWSVIILFLHIPGPAKAGYISSLIFWWKQFINFPYFYETFVLFRDTLPIFTIIIFLLLSGGILVILFRKKESNTAERLFFFILLLLLSFIGSLKLMYFDTRYFLFLYPLIILLSFISLYKIILLFQIHSSVKNITYICAAALIFILSEDFNFNHLTNIDSREINYRYKFSLNKKIHFYPRWDTRTPAEIVNKLASAPDYIITNEQVNDQYLKKLDYIYIDYRSESIQGVSVQGGRRERWTGANLIYNDKDLISFLIKGNRTKWFILNTQWGTRYLKNDNFFNAFRKYAIYSNFDSSAILYKIPPGKNLSYEFLNLKIND